MRVIVDTNVVISAILKDRVPEEIVLFLGAHPEFEWVASREIMDEYLDVLRRPKFGVPEAMLRRWETMLGRLVSLVVVRNEVEFPRDQTDAKFLSCAIAAGADYLVTGDKDLRDARRVGNTVILSVSMFKRLVCDMR